jgi:hypothetical protein
VRCKLKDNFMIEVRVSEETPNLSHPSNLNSTVRLENSSPSLMKLIKASGRTHSWVPKRKRVEEILVRGQEALGEMPRAREVDAATILLREQEILGEMPRGSW